MHPITYLEAVVLGLTQGVTELFPISSLGHSVIIPKLLGWNLDQQNPSFLIFLVATHCATALVLIGFFAREWWQILRGFGRSVASRSLPKGDREARLAWLLIMGTVPAGILGLLLQSKLQAIFASAGTAAFCLMLNGLVLYFAERLRTRSNADAVQPESSIAALRPVQAVGVGIAQAVALIPGFSRSGASMAGGLLVGLDNEAAARFSFLLATPVILAAALLKLPHLFQPEYSDVRGPSLVGALCAALAAYLSVRFLTRYFQTKSLTPFAVYCLLGGALYSLVLLSR